ncbi:hypothetical protein [Synechococcus sp. CBW1107]|nr:hypothetical protein [Synechococcus sp. CBW1107]CAK6697912.1 hypothetical protein IFHNHDMJ_02325 [Synechococcus sp. CBW1107]
MRWIVWLSWPAPSCPSLIRQLREEVEVQIAAAVQRRAGLPPRD